MRDWLSRLRNGLVLAGEERGHSYNIAREFERTCPTKLLTYDLGMAEERIFNIFVYFDGGTAKSFGVRHYRVGGADTEKTAYLLTKVDCDYLHAKRFQLPRNFTAEQWRAAQRLGEVLGYFEEAFKLYRAPPSPIFCLTSVVDGIVKVDLTTGPDPFRGDQVSVQKNRGAVPDYLVHYVEGEQFRFAELVHDEHFLAIRTLFNEGLYVSCAKLLMSCIDTLAFVEFGDVPANFCKWLDCYVDLAPHGISSEELWEFRNSVVHMTNLASRKVVAGKVSPIMLYVGGPASVPAAEGCPKPFNLHELIVSIGNGIGQWAESYNQNRDKLITFIERYDLTISDSRLARFISPDIDPAL
jgi:hypothetical protein